MHRTDAATPIDVRRRRAAATLLVVAAAAQLVGQVLLRTPAADVGGWDLAHLALLLGALSLLAAMVLIALVAGPGVGTWLGLAVFVVGQSLAVAVLAIDLSLTSAEADVVRALDTWDFLAVVGGVVLVLELRRRRGVRPGADLALVALAVPPVDGLVVVAAVAVLAGFVALGRGLVSGRGHGAYAGLAGAAVVAYAVAGTVSWQRAALAVLVLAWTVQHLRAPRPRAALS